MRIDRISKKRLGEILIDEKVLDQKDVDRVLAEQAKSGEFFGEVVLRLELAKEDDILRALVAQFNLPFLDVGQYALDAKLVKSYPEALLRKNRIVPIDRIAGITIFAITGPLAPELITELETLSGGEIQVVLSKFTSVSSAIEKVLSGGDKAKPPAK